MLISTNLKHHNQTQTQNIEMKRGKKKTLSGHLLKIATWNIRGLTSEYKQGQLGIECRRYGVDIVAIQETKTRIAMEKTLKNKDKLISLEQCDGYHKGLGFLVSEKLSNTYSDING